MMGQVADVRLSSAKAWMEFIHPDDSEGVHAAFRNAVVRGRDT
jgi:hypothetical protein